MINTWHGDVRLTKDAELKYTSGGYPIINFSVAWNGRKKEGENWVDDPHFFDCVLMGKTAEAVAKLMTKGSELFIEGELHQSRWEKDGQKHSKVEIFVKQIRVIKGGQEHFNDDVPW